MPLKGSGELNSETMHLRLPNQNEMQIDRFTPSPYAVLVKTDQNGLLHQPSLGQFLYTLRHNKRTKQELPPAWYWTSTVVEHINVRGTCMIDYDTAQIVEIPQAIWDSLPGEQKTFSYGGSGRIAVFVYLSPDQQSAISAIESKVSFVNLDLGESELIRIGREALERIKRFD